AGNEIRFDAVMLACKEFAGAAESGLHLISNQQNSMMPANILYYSEPLERRGDEAAFPQHRLRNNRRYRFGRDNAYECIFEMMRAMHLVAWICQVVRAAITVSERNAVNVRRKRLEACFIRMR